jgi:uncharacterized protein YhaN
VRLLDLHLKAVGPFTERRLDVSGGQHGLHVIYGRNEAGKSSALRALRALLFGFEARTDDDFLHSKDRLRVGGRLRAAGGEEIHIVRRKGNKNTLRGPEDDAALPDETLAPFLGGMSQPLFTALFGIDREQLVAGGEEILEQKGELGQALFAASSGTRNLQALLAGLDQLADGLYTPRGSTKTINRALSSLKETRRTQKDATLLAKDWEAASRRVEEATRGIDRVQADLALLLREKSQAERWLRLLPMLARRQQLLSELEDMGEVVELSDDFAERRREAQTQMEASAEALAEHRRRQDRLREDAKVLAPPRALLEGADRIEDLHQRLGAHRKAQGDRPGLEGKERQARTGAREVLRRLRPDLSLEDVAAARPTIEAARRPLTDLASRYRGLVTANEKAKKAVRDRSAAIASLEEETKQVRGEVDGAALERSVTGARREGDLDRLAEEAARAEAKIDNECAHALASLGLWSGPLDEVPALPAPLHETIDHYDQEFAALEADERAHREKREDTRAKLTDIGRALRAMEIEDTVPVETDLDAARARRSAGWALVKRAWLEQTDITGEVGRLFPEFATLGEAYEASVQRADDIADRMRREATRVAQRAEHLAAREHLALEERRLEQRGIELGARRATLENRWKEEWAACRIDPRSPLEMRGWLSRLESLRARVAALTEAREKQTCLRRTVAEQSASVAGQLRAMGMVPVEEEERLGDLLAAADRALAVIATGVSRRKELQRLHREHAKAEDELERAGADLTAWRDEWRDALRPLGLPEDTQPPFVPSVLESYVELFARIDEADDLHRRIYGIDQDALRFEAMVASVISEVGPDLTDVTPERGVAQLYEALKRTQRDRTRLDEIEKELRDIEGRLPAVEARHLSAREVLRSLCVEARCDRAEALPEAERRSEEYRERRKQQHAVDRSIAEDSGGASIAALLDEMRDRDADRLKTRLAELPQHIGELETERQKLAEQKGAAENELRRMTGVSAAADAAVQAEGILASLRSEVETYARIRAAASLLRREIERFQRENQSPMLARGGDHFSALTCGAFLGVRAEVGDADRPFLVGVRRDGAKVRVEGMSSGTRDQLFLALRLSAIEDYVARKEPVPFVVDDILVQFDDHRARAALNVLASLSRMTQVLLFTHHERIRAMAEGLRPEHEIFVQELL